MKQKKTGKHEHVSNLITEEIRKISEEDSKWFRKNFNALKRLRVKADYETGIVSLDDGKDALNKTNAINNLIKKTIIK